MPNENEMGTVYGEAEDYAAMPTVEPAEAKNPTEFPGALAAILVPEGCTVTRKKEPSSTQLHYNGTLAAHTAVWLDGQPVDVDGVARVHITAPCDGWIDAKAATLGQVCVVNAVVGATVRAGVELTSEVVGELAYETRVFLTEQKTTADGKVARARVRSPVDGWLSVKCVLPIISRLGEVLAAGTTVVALDDVKEAGLVYSHYHEIDHRHMYKLLWQSGLMYGPTFRTVKRAWRTDTEAIGVVGPTGAQHDGFLIHPAIADGMLHLTAIAPRPPKEGWPWLDPNSKEEVSYGW